MSHAARAIARRDLLAQSGALAGLVLSGGTGLPTNLGFAGPIPGQAGQGNWLVSVMAYGAKGDGVTDDSAAIINAAGVAASAGGCIFFPPAPHGYRIARDVRIPETVVAFFPPGAALLPDASVRVSFGGPLFAFPTTIALGRGTVLFERAMTVLPEWFGASDDGATDAGVPLTRAVEAAATRSAILLSGRRYLFTTGVRVPAHKSLSIEGVGPGTELHMAPGFGKDHALLTFAGSASQRTVDQAVRRLRIEGTGQDTDGIALAFDYATNVRIEYVQIYRVGNSAVDIRHSWDVTLDSLRVFGCGGGPAGAPAVYAGESTSEGIENVNTVTLRSADIERSFGVGLLLQTLSSVTIVGCKFHGRTLRDVRASDSRELLYLRNARLVRLTGCAFTQARTDSQTGALRVGGRRSTISIAATTFEGIGDDDTYAVFFDCTDPASRVVAAALLFNDERNKTPYVHVGPRLPVAAFQLGSVAAASPQRIR